LSCDQTSVSAGAQATSTMFIPFSARSDIGVKMLFMDPGLSSGANQVLESIIAELVKTLLTRHCEEQSDEAIY